VPYLLTIVVQHCIDILWLLNLTQYPHDN